MSKKPIVIVLILLFLIIAVAAAGFIFLGDGYSDYFSMNQSASPDSNISSDSSGSSANGSVSSDLPAEPAAPQQQVEESYVGKISDTHLQNMFYVYNGKRFYSSYPNGSAARVERSRFSMNSSYDEVCSFL
ncbi:hypothetical protein MsAg5_07440 [Methanosarcinaceae archaeon Ag5]|uniref:Uncharacterized protein n=1 Tax=Methanolapillus africanus TaxID=3028297 RepID=A0AAE4MJ27_9EURY|nr:hypothetical protein [Methanosarcinaceae archaeon Ag5]